MLNKSKFLKSFCQFSSYRTYCLITNTCWQCKVETKQIFVCDNCGNLLQINRNLDYFKILGLENQFDIEPAMLTQKYRQLQNILHPDKFGNKSDENQKLSIDWSSFVNEAYQTLAVPLKRAEYILKQHGITISEDTNVTDKEFLMEMMERNEEIDEITNSNTNKIFELQNKLQKDIEIIVDKLQQSLEARNLETAKDNLIIFRYLIRLDRSLKEKAVEFGVVK